jgi:hypothetical protein
MSQYLIYGILESGEHQSGFFQESVRVKLLVGRPPVIQEYLFGNFSLNKRFLSLFGVLDTVDA